MATPAKKARKPAAKRAPEPSPDAAPEEVPQQEPAPDAPEVPQPVPVILVAAQPSSPGLAYLALVLAIVPALVEVAYLAYGDGVWDTPDAFIVPTMALLLPITAGIAAAIALSARSSPQDGARTAATVALVIAAAIVATWGLWMILVMLFWLTWHPSPQPCNVTCQTSGHATCCNGCGQPHSGGCCHSGTNPDCCGSSGSSSGGSGCCSGSGSSQSGSGGCCGSSSSSSGGSSSGGCCGSSSSGSGGTSGGGGSGTGHAAPGGGFAAVTGGLSGALALRRAAVAGSWAHHPDTPQYAADVYNVAGMRLCIGCFTTFPLFVLLTPLLALAALPVLWWQMLALGIGFAALQGISAAGLARRRWVKVAVKAGLGAGLALAVVAIRVAPWPLAGRVLAILALAALAYASTIPRRRRMARAAVL